MEIRCVGGGWEGVAKSNSFEVKHAHRLNEFSLRLPLLVENTAEEIAWNPLLLEAQLSELWYIGLLVVRPLGQELLPELPVEALGQVTDPGQPPVNISHQSTSASVQPVLSHPMLKPNGSVMESPRPPYIWTMAGRESA